MDTKEKVKEIVLEILDISETELVYDEPLGESMGVTSVLMVELLAELENQFDIDIPQDDAVNLRTVNAVVSYIEEKIGS